MSHPSFSESSFPPKGKTVVLLKNVCKTYTNDNQILQNFSMSVKQGQIYGLLGSSGCGKSTVLSCIIGLLKWDSGTITVFGEDVRPSTLTHNIGYMPQNHALYNQLTVGEMLQFFAKLYQISDNKLKERLTLLENLLKLDGYDSRKICTLSGGQQRRISLALTMMHDPKLLILDEPTVGLDPLLREKIWDHLFKLAANQNTTIIITTHYIEEVKHAHMVGIMRRGNLLVENDPSVLMKVQNTFLLEDVVLKICKMDNSTNDQTTALTFSGFNSISTANENECRNELIGWRPAEAKTKLMEDVSFKSFNRIWAYNKVIWINFLRQPIFIILLMVLPPIQIITTGVVIGTLPLQNSLGIVNNEVLNVRGNCTQIMEKRTCNLKLLSCTFLKFLNSSNYLKVIEFSSNEKARLAVKRGNIMGYIEIPNNYSSHMIDRAMSGLYPEHTTLNGTIVKINLDMSNSIITYTMIESIYGSFAKLVDELSSSCNIDIRRFDDSIFFRNPVYGNQDAKVTEYMLPSLITCILFEVSFIAAPLVLINELEMETFKRSQVAGLKRWEMTSGIFLAVSAITLFQAIVCLVSVEFILGFHVVGSFWTFILLCLVTAFCNTAFGLLIGIWLRDTVAIILTEIFLFPTLAIHSGLFRVLEVVPDPFRTFIYYGIPNVSITNSLRWIMSRGVKLTHPMVWPGVLVTIAWGSAFTIICSFLIRRM